jgi:hypothetical protein
LNPRSIARTAALPNWRRCRPRRACSYMCAQVAELGYARAKVVAACSARTDRSRAHQIRPRRLLRGIRGPNLSNLGAHHSKGVRLRRREASSQYRLTSRQHRCVLASVPSPDDTWTLPNRDFMNANAVAVIRAPAGGATAIFGSDIARVLDDGELRVLAVLGKGATDPHDFAARLLAAARIRAKMASSPGGMSQSGTGSRCIPQPISGLCPGSSRLVSMKSATKKLG